MSDTDTVIFAADDPAPASAADKIKDFHDTHMAGSTERGIGSAFHGLSQSHKTHYAALEAQVEAEKTLSDAASALSLAQTAYDAAVARSAETEAALPATADLSGQEGAA